MKFPANLLVVICIMMAPHLDVKAQGSTMISAGIETMIVKDYTGVGLIGRIEGYPSKHPKWRFLATVGAVYYGHVGGELGGGGKYFFKENEGIYVSTDLMFIFVDVPIVALSPGFGYRKGKFDFGIRADLMSAQLVNPNWPADPNAPKFIGKNMTGFSIRATYVLFSREKK
jgi:hypothetical protein